MTSIDATAQAAPGLATPASAVTAGPVRFVGRSDSYWRLLVRGALLLMVTLGIYRFWLATDVRRYLWSNTEVNGESLEYTGTAQELLIGFLIAIALLVPIYVLLALASLSLGPVGEFISSLGLPLLAFLGQIAVYRARRYRLTRTVFRGVRFHQDGKAWRYAICALFWWGINALTLGLSYPFGQARLERFKLRHTYYGNLQGSFVGAGWRLFLRGLLMWLLVMLPLAFALIYPFSTGIDWDAVVSALSSAKGGSDPLARLGPQRDAVIEAALVSVSGVVASLLMALMLFPAFQAMMLRWWASGIRFGEVRFGSRLRTVHIYGGYLRFLGYSLLFVVAAAAIAAIGIAAFHFLIAPSLPSEYVEYAGVGRGHRPLCHHDARILHYLSGHREADAMAPRRGINRAFRRRCA